MFGQRLDCRGSHWSGVLAKIGSPTSATCFLNAAKTKVIAGRANYEKHWGFEIKYSERSVARSNAQQSVSIGGVSEERLSRNSWLMGINKADITSFRQHVFSSQVKTNATPEKSFTPL